MGGITILTAAWSALGKDGSKSAQAAIGRALTGRKVFPNDGDTFTNREPRPLPIGKGPFTEWTVDMGDGHSGSTRLIVKDADNMWVTTSHYVRDEQKNTNLIKVPNDILDTHGSLIF